MDSGTPVPAAVEPRVSARTWWIVAVLCLLYVVSIIDRQVMNIIAPSIKADLGLSDLQLSLLLGPSFALFYTLCALPLGAVADRFSRRWLIWAGVMVWSVAAVICGLSRSYGQLFLGRLGVGAGEAALSPAAFSLFSDIFPRRRLTFAASLFASSATVGGALALALGGLLLDWSQTVEDVAWPWIGAVSDWQLVLLITGAPGIVLALLVFTFREPLRLGRSRSDASGSFGELGAFLLSRRRVMVHLLGGFSLASLIIYGLTTWTPSYMGRQFGLSASQIGLIFGLVAGICGFLSHALKGMIVDYFFARGVRDIHFRMYVYCALVSAPLAILAYLTPSLPLFIAGLSVTLLMLTPFLGYASAALQLITPNELRGKMSAVFLLVITLVGLGLGAPLVAVLTDGLYRSELRLGWSIATLIAVVTPLASTILWTGRRPLRIAMEQAEAWR